MLKPNELFIGAVVNYDTGEGIEPFAMAAQGLLFMEENPITFNDDHSPIPLTPEILTDWCGGWKAFNTEKSIIIYFGKNNSFACKFNKPTGTYLIGWQGLEFVHIQYLHQLQALYQLLTGEVMPIKLPKE